MLKSIVFSPKTFVEFVSILWVPVMSFSPPFLPLPHLLRESAISWLHMRGKRRRRRLLKITSSEEPRRH